MDILALQEHWLHSTELSLFSSLEDDIMFCSTSPMESNHILSGRPYGGIALLWHKQYDHLIAPVKTASERMVAVQLRSCSGIILVISIYMPTEYGNSEALEDYNMELRYLDGILDAEVYDAVVVLGDFNADHILHVSQIVNLGDSQSC